MLNVLIKYLTGHDCTVSAEPADGGIAVTCEVSKEGLLMHESEVIPATLDACRDWLGY